METTAISATYMVLGWAVGLVIYTLLARSQIYWSFIDRIVGLFLNSPRAKRGPRM